MILIFRIIENLEPSTTLSEENDELDSKGPNSKILVLACTSGDDPFPSLGGERLARCPCAERADQDAGVCTSANRDTDDRRFAY